MCRTDELFVLEHAKCLRMLRQARQSTKGWDWFVVWHAAVLFRLTTFEHNRWRPTRTRQELRRLVTVSLLLNRIAAPP